MHKPICTTKENAMRVHMYVSTVNTYVHVHVQITVAY